MDDARRLPPGPRLPRAFQSVGMMRLRHRWVPRLHRRYGDAFTVRLLRDPLNFPERIAWLYAWYDALRDVIEAQMTLGLAYVAWAQPTSVRIEADGFTYAGVLMDVVEMDVTVRLDEVITTLGA